MQKLDYGGAEPTTLIPKLLTKVPKTRQQHNEPKFNSNSEFIINEHCTHTCDEIKQDDYSENGTMYGIQEQMYTKAGNRKE